MIEKDSGAYITGKYRFSLKTPLTPAEVKSAFQSVVGSIAQPTGERLQSTLTRYYGAVQRNTFWLKKSVAQPSNEQQPIIIDGTFAEKGVGTRLEITIIGTSMRAIYCPYCFISH